MFIHHIEDVHYLIDIRGDSSQMNSQTMVEQRLRQRVKKTLRISSENVDDRKSFGTVIIDPDFRFLPNQRRNLCDSSP